MRVAPKVSDHSVIGRALADRTVKPRDPSLINLPIPLPSIPILSPILSPVIGGSNQNQNSATTSSSSSSPSPTPSPSQPATTPSNGNGGDQGNNGGGSGGDNGDNGNNNGNSGNGGSSGGGSTGTTDGGGSGGGNSGSDQGSGSNDNPTTTTGGSSTSGNQDTPSSGGGSATNGTDPGDSSSGTAVSNSGPSTTSTDSQSNGSALHSNEGGAANAAPIPTGTSAGGTGTSQTISGHGSAGTHSASATGSGSNGNTSGTGNTNDGNAPGNEVGATSKHGISGGAIAAIVICLLLFLICAFVFLVRKRRKARRDERANIWWFTRKRNSQTYGDRFSKEIMPSNRSVRSSFATTVDRSGSPRPATFQDIPPLPPMAEVGRADGAAPKLIIEPSAFHLTLTDGQHDHRFSIGSGESGGDTQYLMVHHRDSVNQESPRTPMSVRPFSPSESFAFPKPPDPVGDRTSAYSRPSSGSTFALRNSLHSGQLPSSPIIPPTPALPSAPAGIMSPINKVIDPFADNNPFDDPQIVAPPSNSTGEFSDIEFIRRPFYPTLPDEVAVRPDDPVRIIQSFDDGWALVEKVHMDQPMGRSDGDNVRGLIPIDCLREPGQDLPSFYAAKRVSSYAGSEVGYNAI